MPQASASPDASPSTAAEALSPDQVRRLARRARLHFTDEEVEAMADDLTRLLKYAWQLDEVDTAGVEPMAPGAPDAPQRLRADDPQKPLAQQEALENAPDAATDADGFFRVPAAPEE